MFFEGTRKSENVFMRNAGGSYLWELCVYLKISEGFWDELIVSPRTLLDEMMLERTNSTSEHLNCVFCDFFHLISKCKIPGTLE